MMVSDIVIFSVYQMPARAMSNRAESFISTLRLYHRGYFHLNKVLSIFRSLLSFNGDSPSAKVQ